MSKLKSFIASKGYTFSAISKANLLLKQGTVDDAKLAIALKSTKPYKENSELRNLCTEILEKEGKVQQENTKSEPVRSSSARYGERTRF